MSSEVNFLSEVSHAIDLKAEMKSRRQILTAVEVTEVIEKVRVRQNKNLLDEVKKIRSAILAAWNC